MHQNSETTINNWLGPTDSLKEQAAINIQKFINKDIYSNMKNRKHIESPKIRNEQY